MTVHRYNFDRYVGFRLMAEGIAVHASDMQDALEKAESLRKNHGEFAFIDLKEERLVFIDNARCPDAVRCRICSPEEETRKAGDRNRIGETRRGDTMTPEERAKGIARSIGFGEDSPVYQNLLSEFREAIRLALERWRRALDRTSRHHASARSPTTGGGLSVDYLTLHGRAGDQTHEACRQRGSHRVTPMPSKLTASILNREALVMFLNARGEIPEEPAGGELKQVHVDAIISEDDLKLPLEELSNRVIKPCAEALAKAIPHGARFSPEMLELPEGVYGAAADRFRGVALRTCIGTSIAPVYADGAWDGWKEGDREPSPIWYEEHLIVRFDLRYSN